MQLSEIVNHCNFIQTVDDLLNHFDSIVELGKDDVKKIAKSRQIFFADFDFTYSDASDLLSKQLQKTHLKAIKKFISCKNIDDAIQWLLARLLNNMRNLSTNKKYKLYISPKFLELHENIEADSELDKIIELSELTKFDSNTLKAGLQQVWEDSIFDDDFDWVDFDELCEKFNFKGEKIIRNELATMPKSRKEQTESGNFQLVMVF